MLLRFIRDEYGATAIEYALLAGLIALTIIPVAQSLGASLKAKFAAIAAAI